MRPLSILIASFAFGLLVTATPARATAGGGSENCCVSECEGHGEAVFHAYITTDVPAFEAEFNAHLKHLCWD